MIKYCLLKKCSQRNNIRRLAVIEDFDWNQDLR